MDIRLKGCPPASGGVGPFLLWSTMDAIEMLKSEHKGAKRAMEQILKSPTVRIRRLFEALSKELETHDRIEEQIFYPAVLSHPKASAFPAMDKKAHLEVEAALKSLEKLAVESKEWIPAFKVMQEKLLKHVSDEENNFFVAIRASLNSAELNELGEKMKNGKKDFVKVA